MIESTANLSQGGKLFFDLFVSMCNHMDDIVELTQVPHLL
jgi:hypothetical protein